MLYWVIYTVFEHIFCKKRLEVSCFVKSMGC